jgi:uncharacterized peroxidase-related enzyme
VNRLIQVTPETATPKQQTVLEKTQAKYGNIPAMMAMMANSPNVLNGYLDLSTSLVGTLSRPLREQIAVAVAEYNRCPYCLAAHVVGAQRNGVSDAAIHAARQFTSEDAKTAAALRLAHRIVTGRGHVSDDDLQQVRNAGYDDTEIVEIFGTVILNIFTNYFNILADTEPEEPRVPFLTALNEA